MKALQEILYNTTCFFFFPRRGFIQHIHVLLFMLCHTLPTLLQHLTASNYWVIPLGYHIAFVPRPSPSRHRSHRSPHLERSSRRLDSSATARVAYAQARFARPWHCGARCWSPCASVRCRMRKIRRSCRIPSTSTLQQAVS